MNDIQIFQNNQFGQIRVATTDSGDPIFCLADLCQALSLTTPTRVKERLDDDMSQTHPIIDSLGREQQATFVTEPGMYTVILRSDSPKAKPMQKWVTSEILPTIRKHGAYMTQQKIEEVLSNPDTIIRLATDLKAEQAKRLAAEKQVAVLAPKAQFLDKVFDADEKIDIGQAAKILGLPYGRNTLFKNLREKGIFFKNRNEPKQEYVDRGYFQLKEKWIDRNNHDGFVVIKVLVTQSGLAYLDKTLSANRNETMKLAAVT